MSETDTSDWNGASYVVSSRYRTAVIAELQNGPATPSRIAKNAGLLITHVSRALGELEEKGFVHLLVSEDTKRGRLYDLTDDGADVADRVDEVIDR